MYSACVEIGGFNANPEAPGSDERAVRRFLEILESLPSEDWSWAGLRVPTNKYHNI